MLAGLVVLHGAHRDVALGVVGAGGDDLGIFALALDELEGELAFLEVAAVQDLGRGDLVGDAELIRIRLVAVVELRLVGALQLVRSAERAVAVVGDGGHDGIGLAVVGDAVAGGSTVDLAQRVGVLAGLGVLDGVHRDLAASVVGAGGDDLGIFALALDELEGELVGLEVAAGQDLGRRDLVSNAEALGGHRVGVLEDRLLGVLQFVLNRKLAVSVIGDGRHDGIGGVTVGNTVVGIDLGLAQRVGVRTGLGVGDSLHRDCAVSRIGALDDDLVALDELEGELSRLEVAAVQGLGRLDLVGDAGDLGARLVGVGELGLLGFLQDMLRLERAVALVGDGGLDGVLGVTVGDALAGGSAVGLAQRVGVPAGLVVLHGAHRDVALSVVGAGGDDLGIFALALDELEGELAFLEVAAVQDLGRGDLVGDAELVRIRLVGVLECRGFGILQLVLRLELTLAVVGDRSHDGVGLAIVGNTVAFGALGLAQRVGVLAGLVVLHGAHRDVALGVVGAGGDDLGVLALALDELEGELAGRELTPGQGLGRLDLFGDAGVLGRHGVGVRKLNLLDVLGALQLMRGHKLALAIVGDDRHDGIDGFVVGDAAGVALNLAQRIGVLANLGVLDGAKRNLAIGVVLDGLDNLRVFAVALNEFEGELAGLELAASQSLGDCNLVGDARIDGVRGVGVLELGFTRGLLHRSLELALHVGLHRHGELRNVLAVGDAVNRGPGMLLADPVDIRAGLVIGDLTEADSRMALGRDRGRELGHRGIVLGRQAKLKLVLIRPTTPLEHLGQAKVGSCQRCRLGIERKVDLAVIAQINIDLRRAGDNLRVVPLGIDHVARGVRRVSAHTLLGGVELIDKGEARGTGLD